MVLLSTSPHPNLPPASAGNRLGCMRAPTSLRRALDGWNGDKFGGGVRYAEEHHARAPLKTMTNSVKTAHFLLRRNLLRKKRLLTARALYTAD